LKGVTVLEQIQDVRVGYQIFTRFSGQPGRPARVLVIGSSAGAHLAALIALAEPGECGEDAQAPAAEGDLLPDWVPPSGAVLVSCPATFEPWTDILPSLWDTMQQVAGVSYGADPEFFRRISPVSYARSGACPVLFLHAEYEHLFPLENILHFIGLMRGAGGLAAYRTYPRAEHGFFYDISRRQQKRAFADILSFAENPSSFAVT